MKDESGKIGVAVIGLGVGEQHARAYLQTGHCRLDWLYDLDRGRALRLAGELGSGGAAESYEQILNDPSVEVVSIASYDADHFAQAMSALKAGKHVFVEKPVCRTRDEVKQVHEAWRQSGGPKRALSSNLVLRSARLYQKLRDFLADGFLGRIYAIDGEYLYGRLHKIINGWRGYEKNYSVMAGGGVHMIDLVIWLTNSRPVSIHAAGNRICTEGTIFEHKDYITTIAEMSDGSIARFTANFGCMHKHQHVLRIYGTKGTFLYDDAGARVHFSHDPETSATPWAESPISITKGDLISDFIRGIRQHRDWTLEVQACLDVINVCAACDESLANKTRVEVQYT